MTHQEIEILFEKEAQKEDFRKKTGVSRQVWYNYKSRQNPKLGTMLEALLKCDVIKIIQK